LRNLTQIIGQQSFAGGPFSATKNADRRQNTSSTRRRGESVRDENQRGNESNPIAWPGMYLSRSDDNCEAPHSGGVQMQGCIQQHIQNLTINAQGNMEFIS